MLVKQKLCKTTRDYNEDYIVANENYAFVLDGATGLKKNSDTIDAGWYVQKFSSYLEKHLEAENIPKAVKNSLNEISKDIDNYSKHIDYNLDIPSACIAIVKENKDNYEFFVLGDCSIIYGNRENQTLITNDDIRKLDNDKIEKMISIAKEKNINVCDAYKIIIPDLKKQRLLKNKPNGYYILDIDESVVEHGKYTVISKKDIDMIIIMSDGFSTYYEHLNLEKNYKTFFLKNYDMDVDTLYKQLREREISDKYLNKYPRYKISDDASIIKIIKQ